MQCSRQYGRDNVAACEPREKNRQDGFQTEQGSKAEENSDRDTAGDRLRSVANGEQLERVLPEPTLHVHSLFLSPVKRYHIFIANARTAENIQRRPNRQIDSP